MNKSLEQKQQTITAAATQRQYEAADPKYSVWVSASAGTGKTKILTDRVLRILLDGVRANRILCITFTKAAAAEMSDRISKYLAQWASMDSADLIADLQALTGKQHISESLQNKARSLFTEVLETPGGMRIQTVHSFCQHILERFPREAGVPPNFKILDELENENLLLEARNDLLEILFDRPEDLNLEQQQLAHSLRLLLEYKSESSLTTMLKNARHHQKQLDNLGHLSYEALQKLLAEYLDIDLTISWQTIKQNYVQQLLQHKNQFEALLQAFNNIGTPTEKKDHVPKLEHALYHSDNPLDLVEFFYTGERKIRSLRGLPSAKIKKQHPDLQEFIQQQTILLEDFLKQKANHLCFSFSLAFNHVATHIISGWQQKKLQHMRLSFDDLIFYTSRLLNQASQRRWVQYKLDSSIDHILIDEAQDTNPTQWEVLAALYADFFDGDGIQKQNQRTLFVVGDFKQSIYRFQGARAELFCSMQQDFETRTSHSNINAKIVDLNINFRSTKPILEFTDALINHTDARKGVHDAELPLEHTAQRILESGEVETWPLIYPDQEEDNIAPRPAAEKIAETIAERIKQIIDQPYWIQTKNHKEGRPVHAGDFLILLKKRHPLAVPLIRALGRKNIKTMGSDRLDIFQHMAVQDLLALARFMLQPSDDYSLACILRSPLFDISEDDLFTLSHHRGNTSLFQRLKQCFDQGNNFEIAVQKLEYWRKIVDFRTVFEFFSEILSTGNFERFTTRLGVEAEDALTEFLNFILIWEQQHTSCLELFMRSTSRSDEIKREQQNNDVPAVRIMTVHGAKGLQAPIVILPDQHNDPIKGDKSGLQLHQQDGHRFLLSSPEQPEPDIITTFKEQEKQQLLDEHHRLLYVAITRAQYKLIIAGYSTKPPPKNESASQKNSWYNHIQDLWESKHAPESRIASEILLPFLDKPPLVMEYHGVKDKPQNFDAFIPRKLQPLPEFFHHNPPAEQKPYNPLTAGRVLDDSEIPARSPLDGVKLNLIFNRGNIIHKLLEVLPNISPSQRKSVADGFLKRKIWNLSQSQQDAIYQEVDQLLNHKEFAPLFSKDALAEVPISGIIDDDIITGRIDRLWMNDDQILIIDFKSNRNVPTSVQAVPKLYLRQVEIYRALLKQIYPKKTIKAALLWTYSATLMKID